MNTIRRPTPGACSRNMKLGRGSVALWRSTERSTRSADAARTARPSARTRSTIPRPTSGRDARAVPRGARPRGGRRHRRQDLLRRRAHRRFDRQHQLPRHLRSEDQHLDRRARRCRPSAAGSPARSTRACSWCSAAKCRTRTGRTPRTKPSIPRPTAGARSRRCPAAVTPPTRRPTASTSISRPARSGRAAAR